MLNIINSTVILCIGSDKISGDSLGPAVGDILKNTYDAPFFVYGAEGSSVNGKNLEEYETFISAVHPYSKIIAVDACLFSAGQAGAIKIRMGGVRPGLAAARSCNKVGDIGVLGTVAPSGDNALFSLMTVSTLDVQKLASKIAFVIFYALSSPINNRQLSLGSALRN